MATATPTSLSPVRVRHRWWLGLSGLALAVNLLSPGPGRAAESIIITYGGLQRTIAITDLEQLARTGKLSRQLQAYNRHLGFSPEALAQIRQALSTPTRTLDVVAIAQFLYTEQGELLLQQVTRVVQTPSRQGSFQALRAALILAAAQADRSQGFTLLDVLRAYPLEAIRVDLAGALAVAEEINQAILQSERAVTLVREIADQEARVQANALDLAALRALVQAQQRYGVKRLNLELAGLARPVTLFLPQGRPPRSGFPLVLISHGLGSSRQSYTYLGEYLAAGGLAVAAVEHTGSNDEQLFALLAGQSTTVVPDGEFWQRPQDISLAITGLDRARWRNPDLRGRLDLNRVGVIGQSFGGYTALALGGATVDSQGLEQACPPSRLAFNPSLLLQCQAARLANPGSRLADPRVKAIFIMNPIGGVLFGPSGYGQVTVPTMVVAGAMDTVAPAFAEQIKPFTWLGSDHRYLLLLARGTHFSVIGDTGGDDQPLAIPEALIGPYPELAQGYMQGFAQAFFQVNLLGDERFRPLLQASYAQALAAPEMPLSLITGASADLLTEWLP
ncbi:MAG: alpha/beta hydrolase [Cyanobacteriota bacterium]|nr:alpha/beta hydrolase [Cyanobacteriota bacterium]